MKEGGRAPNREALGHGLIFVFATPGQAIAERELEALDLRAQAREQGSDQRALGIGGDDDGLHPVASTGDLVFPPNLETAHHLGDGDGTLQHRTPDLNVLDVGDVGALRSRGPDQDGQQVLAVAVQADLDTVEGVLQCVGQVRAGDAELAPHLLVEQGTYHLDRFAPVVADLLGVGVGAYQGLGLFRERA